MHKLPLRRPACAVVAGYELGYNEDLLTDNQRANFYFSLRFGQVGLMNKLPLRRPAETPYQKPYAVVAGYELGYDEDLL